MAFLLLLILFLSFFNFSSSALFYGIDILKEFPHDPKAFTEGLLYGSNETLFESTGLYWRSTVRHVSLLTGEVEAVYQMDGHLFGEGLTLVGDRLFQVTYKTKTGFIYNRHNFQNMTTFINHMTDGWGLTTNGNVIFGSDGTSTLYHLDPDTLNVIKSVTVTYNGQEIYNLNELEYVDGEVWANIYRTDCIVRISQDDGRVLGWVLLPELRKGLLQSGLLDPTDEDLVLNGIAWDSDKKRLFVTGKLWPKLYEIKLRPLTSMPKEGIQTLCPLKK